MYLEFYGFAERPFSTTTDPRFFYPTLRHRDALAHLQYGVQDDQGFIVLTGAVGTGKTTVLQKLRSELDENVTAVFIANSMLPFDGILEYLLRELGVDTPATSHAQPLIALETILVARHRANQKTVLVLDEAQNLSPATLEQVRLLSNFEWQGARLLRIVLAGQPELVTNLALPQLQQLRQRVALWSRIEPLSAEDTRHYIRARLRVAGARDAGLFTDRAISQIARYSEGIPRVVNLLCDHCLLIGYADQRRRIEPDIVEEARAQLVSTPPSRQRVRDVARWSGTTLRRWAVGTLAVVAVVAGVGLLLGSHPVDLVDLARSARALLVR